MLYRSEIGLQFFFIKYFAFYVKPSNLDKAKIFLLVPEKNSDLLFLLIDIRVFVIFVQFSLNASKNNKKT